MCLQQASLLGFKSHAAFILDMRMAKDPDSVTTFLADLKTKLQPLKTDEMGLFLQYKKEEVLFLVQFNYLFAQYCAIA